MYINGIRGDTVEQSGLRRNEGSTKPAFTTWMVSACIELFIMCAEFLIIIIKLNSEVFKCGFEIKIIIKIKI